MEDKEKSNYRIENSSGIIAGSDVSVGGHLHIGDVYITKYVNEAAEDSQLSDLPLPDNIAYPQEPFIGLKRFSRAESRVFFGRNWAIKTLHERITEQKKVPILLLYGASGVGKSSLLDAGLGPRLEEQNWSVQYFRRGATKGFSQAYKAVQSKKGTSPSPTLVVFDQVEEVFTIPLSAQQEETELIEYLKTLGEASSHENTPTKVILSFRKEYLPEVESLLISHNLLFSKFYLNPLTQSNLEEVLQSMAAIGDAPWQVKFSSEDLIKQIAVQLAIDNKAPIAPLLQITLKELWERAVHKNHSVPVIEEEDFRKLVREGISLQQFLDSQLQGLVNQQHLQSGLVLDILLQFITEFITANEVQEGIVFERYHHISEGELKGLLQELKDLYLINEVTKDAKNSERYLRLGHDALAPIVSRKYNSSNTAGQGARRLMQNRISELQFEIQSKGLQPESESQVIEIIEQERVDLPVFSKKELRVLKEGRDGMRAFSPSEKTLVNISMERIHKAAQRNRIIYGGAFALLAGMVVLAWLFIGATKSKQQSNITQAREYMEGKDYEAATQIILEEALDYYQDSVFQLLNDISTTFIFSRSLDRAEPLIDFLQELDVDNEIVLMTKAEWAFLNSLGGREDKAKRLLSKVPSVEFRRSDRYLPVLSNLLLFEKHYGPNLTNYFKQKYLPELVFVEGNSDQAIADFFIGKYELTNRQLLTYLNLGVSSTSSTQEIFTSLEYDEEKGWRCGPGMELDGPVFIKGGAARAYCRWLSGDLPSIVEWEYAAQGGKEPDEYVYPGSDDLGEVACYNDQFYEREAQPCPVGRLKPNKLNIFDMAGNVWERCRDAETIKGGDFEVPQNSAKLFKIDDRSFRIPSFSGETIGARIWIPVNTSIPSN